MKSNLVREVRSMQMQCDRVGNLLLAKFACKAARDLLVMFPASVIFWLLDNVPATNILLTAPVGMPAIQREDWSLGVPRVLSVHCTVSSEGLRMLLKLDSRDELTLLLNPPNIELMRQMMQAYRSDLLDVGV